MFSYMDKIRNFFIGVYAIFLAVICVLLTIPILFCNLIMLGLGKVLPTVPINRSKWIDKMADYLQDFENYSRDLLMK
jgi:hypothetical protein